MKPLEVMLQFDTSLEGLVGLNLDLIIYLRSSIPNLVSQIHKRGRDYENSISIDYLRVGSSLTTSSRKALIV